MLWLLFGAHLTGIGGSVIAGRTSMRRGLIVAGIAPALAAIWAITLLVRDGDPTIYERSWVSALDIGFRFQTTDTALLMASLVSGIGALVFLYGAGYFSANAAGGMRFPASLLAFATSMFGLVLADSVWTLFIFWELTSVTSFLLVGHKHTDPATQAAARRALMITGGGGLALLAGLLVLADELGTTTLSALEPVSGNAGIIAAVLVLVGVATKSAQVPFHVWLPGAMAAPTPVSAYLHSATMVKAGVFLMAVVTPAFVDVEVWKVLGVVFGALSMIWGAVGALRQADAKLILAWGTISQLGLLVTLLALGSPKAIFAAISILFAHALFKAALFLVVGEIDIRTGTRDIRELGNLYRTMPVATAVAVLAGASMAGVPPSIGFAAKEAAVEAALGLSGTERVVAVAVIVGGSVLTVAYTARFLITVFGPGPDTQVQPVRAAMTMPSVVLGAMGLIGFFTLDTVTAIVGPSAVEIDPKADVYKLKAWPGFTDAFLTSVGIVAAGIVVGLVIARRRISVPEPLGAAMADDSLDRTLGLAGWVTSRVQHGSLPVYLTTMAGAALLATSAFAADLSFDHLVWDKPLPLAVALVTAVAAVAAVFVTNRLGAALALGSVGIGVTGLFVLWGAPDLALTQVLVETIVVVGFVVGLGHLTQSFPTAERTWLRVRVLISVLGGLGVVVALVVASADPSGVPPIEGFATEAVETGGGNNIVNVILTDVRALDTLGEVVVLATVAIGISALAPGRLRRRGEEVNA
ncbi:MAG: hydrogen gas-evolving membrane-bound hydrogenase subunit E [Actinomycetota bacterium]